MRTFDIMGEFNALFTMMEEVDENGEFINNDDTLKVLLDELNQSKSDKLDNIELIKRDYNAKADSLKAEIDRLSKRKKSFENQVDKLQSLQELLLNEDGFKTDRFTFSYRKSESVEISEKIKLDDLTDEFKRIKTVIEPDKKAIKEALKGVIPECFYVCSGVEKDGKIYKSLGITLKQNVSLQVR